MDTPTDNTAVIRMKRDFDHFLSVPARTLGKKLKFSSDHPSGSDREVDTSSASIPVKSLFDKEEKAMQLKAELIGAKSRITELESELSSVRKAALLASVDKESAVASMKAERQREKDRAVEKEVLYKTLTEREKHARESLADSERERSRLKADYEKRLAAVQKNLRLAEEEAMKIREDNWKKVSEVRNEKLRIEAERTICQNELEETKAMLEHQTKRVADMTSVVEEYEELKMKVVNLQQTIAEMETKMLLDEDNKVIVRNMKNELDNLPQMETDLAKFKEENKFLKETRMNGLILEEQCRGLQQKLEKARASLADLHRLQVENEELKGRLYRWEALDNSGSRRPQSPSELSRRVAELQETTALQLHQLGERSSEIDILKQRIAQKQAECDKLGRQLEEASRVMKQKDETIRLFRQNSVLSEQENKSLQAMMRTLQGPGRGGRDATQQMELMERHLAQYRSSVTNLQAEVERRDEQLREALARNAQTMPDRGANLTSSSNDEIRQLKEKIAVLETDLMKVEEEKSVLEARIEQRHLQGEYDPSKVKVVSFRNNPFEQAKQRRAEELETLRKDNRKLKERLTLLEEAGGSVEDVTQKVEAVLQKPSLDTQLKEVTDQLNSEKLQNTRLMEAFKKMSQEFREICYQLMGYKIDIPCTKQYRLTSMYAEAPQDYLLFKQSDSGEIQMLETDFSVTVKDLIESYLQKQDSIPAFLSSVTLELFSRQTMNLG